MLTGLVLTLPVVAVEGVPSGLDAGVGAWLVLVGAGNVVGLVFLYAGLRIGKVGVVAPIASTEGAVTAVIAVAAGEHIGTAAGVALIVIVVGVVLAATTRGGARVDPARSRRAVLFAIGAALWFGAGLYAAGRVSTEVPVGWILLPTRAMGVLVRRSPARGAIAPSREPERASIPGRSWDRGGRRCRVLRDRRSARNRHCSRDGVAVRGDRDHRRIRSLPGTSDTDSDRRRRGDRSGSRRDQRTHGLSVMRSTAWPRATKISATSSGGKSPWSTTPGVAESAPRGRPGSSTAPP